ncbi:Heat shock protein DnaJ-like protein [Trichormus variabilis ATCC 29413]|uniref:Heat shock protein DnaJ-like protein n=2 Tax=Anabaena variabilis TaxID=264691 RepID=Q3MA64_TRIV2|nr:MULTISPECIES: J domain-containing protein [Nostocaceae]ABA22122.1 Heat shock protein DnaJ-like protein [Trichormus variabilis ATCC 29413]MBC1215729.1 J domain-containing protein [Trichormus variabilis ARAD]MBC1256847.1 J domain-containing protein [Trichormus variabilis V5]MBC1268160.1 J domain-containing protein [Trichormus variabilis FSR]MBC1304285.1 J domain-containing protein [Trichormus variabilis N2B]
MVDSKKDLNHYEILKVSPKASQAEIKQAYRRLVKLFHPDSNQDTADKEQIIRINAAYEILGDNQSRLNYDEELRDKSQKFKGDRLQRTTSAQKEYQVKRKSGKDADEQVEEWLRLVYQPVNRLLSTILSSLEEQIEELAADPFDDELLDEFQEYLQTCKDDFKQAQTIFRSRPNPPSMARAAAHLYYSLNQVADGLEELAYFPLNYDDRYLHTGQELFRIATRLHYEAQASVSSH